MEIANLIIETLNKYEISISDCRGQGCNNAANMAGKYKSAHKYTSDVNPLCIQALRVLSLRDGTLTLKNRFAVFVRSCSALRTRGISVCQDDSPFGAISTIEVEVANLSV